MIIQCNWNILTLFGHLYADNYEITVKAALQFYLNVVDL